MKNYSTRKRLASIPIPATLFVLAMGLFLWGAYTASPWNLPAMPVDKTFSHQEYVETGLGIVYMLIGAVRIVGTLLKSRKLMLLAPYGLMMGYLFLALLRIVVVGWFPVTWLPLLICALISGICRLALLYGPETDR